MAIKTVNNTAGPNGLVPMLLVFGAYPRITKEGPLTRDIVERGEVIKKAMEKL
jgi:hypothetical protein